MEKKKYNISFDVSLQRMNEISQLSFAMSFLNSSALP